MAWGSTAPAAMTGLAAVVKLRIAGLAVPTGGSAPRILVGGVVTDAGTKEAIDIGWATEDQPAAEATLSRYTTAADLEEYVIHNAIRILKGRDPVAARARALALLGEVGTAIQTDRSLAGTVMTSWVSAWSLEGQQSQRGALATVLFDVSCQAETN
jgi:hypothetical protein